MGTEFDILEGVTMSHVHPPDKLDGFKKSDLAALCIPDGGHKVLVHDNRDDNDMGAAACGGGDDND